MKYVLDTNAFSLLMSGRPAVVNRFAVVSPGDVAVPHPVLAEVAYGIERLPRSKRKDQLRARFDRLCEEIPRAAWTDDVTLRFAEIKASLERKGRRIEDFDAAIAAHALAAGATLVTADRDHMTRVPGLRVVDWSADGDFADP